MNVKNRNIEGVKVSSTPAGDVVVVRIAVSKPISSAHIFLVFHAVKMETLDKRIIEKACGGIGSSAGLGFPDGFILAGALAVPSNGTPEAVESGLDELDETGRRLKHHPHCFPRLYLERRLDAMFAFENGQAETDPNIGDVVSHYTGVRGARPDRAEESMFRRLAASPRRSFSAGDVLVPWSPVGGAGGMVGENPELCIALSSGWAFRRRNRMRCRFIEGVLRCSAKGDRS